MVNNIATTSQHIAQRAQTAMRAGRYLEALADLATLKDRAPQDASIELMYAYVYRAQGESEKSKKAFTRTLSLTPHDHQIRATYASYLDDLGEYAASIQQYEQVLKAIPTAIDVRIDMLMVKQKTNEAQAALTALQKLSETNKNHIRLHANLAIIALQRKDYENAEFWAEKTLQLQANHPRANYIKASVQLIQGKKEATSLLLKARQASPQNLDIIVDLAAAYIRNGDGKRALTILGEEVDKNITWYKGHREYAEMAWQLGMGLTSLDKLKEAIDRQKQNDILWGSYINLITALSGAEAGLSIAEEGLAHNPNSHLLHKIRLATLSEAGQWQEAAKIFPQHKVGVDIDFDIAQIRNLIRLHEFEEAKNLCNIWVEKNQESMEIWAYLLSIYRLTGDARAKWLIGEPAFHNFTDVDLNGTSLDNIAKTVYKMHNFSEQPTRQSVKGGTQTDGHLFLFKNEVIMALRRSIEGALSHYIKHLPPSDKKHPLLRFITPHYHFTGSWSVLLKQAGFHKSHIHSQGVISSAFYLTLPDDIGKDNGENDRNARRGWLQIGGAPSSLNIDLEPLAFFKPRPGALALFPSYMWHGTLPFDAGERLTCAFDVAFA